MPGAAVNNDVPEDEEKTGEVLMHFFDTTIFLF
jgi:hypothetical protein